MQKEVMQTNDNLLFIETFNQMNAIAKEKGLQCVVILADHEDTVIQGELEEHHLRQLVNFGLETLPITKQELLIEAATSEFKRFKTNVWPIVEALIKVGSEEIQEDEDTESENTTHLDVFEAENNEAVKPENIEETPLKTEDIVSNGLANETPKEELSQQAELKLLTYIVPKVHLTQKGDFQHLNAVQIIEKIQSHDPEFFAWPEAVDKLMVDNDVIEEDTFPISYYVSFDFTENKVEEKTPEVTKKPNKKAKKRTDKVN